MSFITDGMAQVHCELPWQANLQAFTDKLTQHFQGVLEHGQKISIFRTFENVGTGSNLMIHCILRIMEDRRVTFMTNANFQRFHLFFLHIVFAACDDL